MTSRDVAGRPTKASSPGAPPPTPPDSSRLAPSSALHKASRRDWIGLAVIALPCLLYSMDATVLNLALPRISAELSPSATELLWIVDIYGFFLAGALVTMGTLGDRIGRRRLLLIGAAAFGAVSIFAASATTAPMLIVARALLGLASATLAPSTLSLIRNMFLDEKQRALAVSVWIASFSAGAAMGPVIGGVLLAHYGWGSVFLISVPVMALLLVLGPRLLPEFRDPNAGRLDLVSAALSGAAVLSMIYGIKSAAEHGPSRIAVLAVAIGIGALIAFARKQKQLAHPLIDLGLFRTPAFTAALLANLLTFGVLFGTFLLVGQYLQLVLGMDPFVAGLWSAPSGVAFVAGSMGTPLLGRWLRPAYIVAAGLAVGALGLGVLTQVGGLGALVTGFVVLSIGVAPVAATITELVIRAAPPERAGAASALSETSSELGGAVGVALLGSVVGFVYRGSLVLGAGLTDGDASAARSTLGGAMAVAARLPSAELASSARDAFTRAFHIGAGIGASTLLVTSILAALLLRRVAAPSNVDDVPALGVAQ